MPVRLMEANPLVEETRNQVAVKRGPIVYCLESPDLPEGVRVQDVAVSAGPPSSRHDYDAELLDGVTVIEANALPRGRPATGMASCIARCRTHAERQDSRRDSFRTTPGRIAGRRKCPSGCRASKCGSRSITWHAFEPEHVRSSASQARLARPCRHLRSPRFRPIARSIQLARYAQPIDRAVIRIDSADAFGVDEVVARSIAQAPLAGAGDDVVGRPHRRNRLRPVRPAVSRWAASRRR